jgi:hypothetical protein
MSSRKLKKVLEQKGYPVESINYIRNAPTPTGFGKGYDIGFVNHDDSFLEIEDIVFDIDPDIQLDAHMEFDTFNDALNFVNSLPVLELNKGMKR